MNDYKTTDREHAEVVQPFTAQLRGDVLHRALDR